MFDRRGANRNGGNRWIGKHEPQAQFVRGHASLIEQVIVRKQLLSPRFGQPDWLCRQLFIGSLRLGELRRTPVFINVLQPPSVIVTALSPGSLALSVVGR